MPRRYKITDRRNSPAYRPGYQLIVEAGLLKNEILPDVYYSNEDAIETAKRMLAADDSLIIVKIMEEKVVATVERL